MKKILCVEDLADIRLLLKGALSPSFEVTFAVDVADARRQLARERFSGILLDIGLPDEDGMKFCAELKNSVEFKQVPIFIVSANHSIQEKTVGFRLGIEDYISKPFHPTELRIRVEARLLKNEESKSDAEELVLGNLKISFPTYRAYALTSEGAADLGLSATEFRILAYLARHFEHVKTREQIIEEVWSHSTHLSDRVVDAHVSRLRKKLSACDITLRSTPGAGYALVTTEMNKRAA